MLLVLGLEAMTTATNATATAGKIVLTTAGQF